MLDSLKIVSAKLGSQKTLIQGAGGNTSIKINNSLWVKASGRWLINALTEDIFVETNLKTLISSVDDVKDYDLSNFLISGDGKPSIEAPFHAIIPWRVVLHVHSVNIIAHAILIDGKNILSEKLIGLDWAWVTYQRPGYPLTREIARHLNKNKIWILQNHGLIVGGDSEEEAYNLLMDVENRLELPLASLNEPCKSSKQHLDGWELLDNEKLTKISCSNEMLNLATGGVMYPDHIIFLDRLMPVVDSLNNIDSNILLNSKVIICRGGGFFIKQNSTESCREMLNCLAEVVFRIPHNHGIRYLTDQDLYDLTNWDAEKYRKNIER